MAAMRGSYSAALVSVAGNAALISFWLSNRDALGKLPGGGPVVATLSLMIAIFGFLFYRLRRNSLSEFCLPETARRTNGGAWNRLGDLLSARHRQAVTDADAGRHDGFICLAVSCVGSLCILDYRDTGWAHAVVRAQLLSLRCPR